MRASVYTDFGTPEVLQLREVEKPVPDKNEILVRVYASAVNYGDITARNFKNLPLSQFHMPLIFWLPTRIAFGLNKPKINILGSEFAGEIEALGQAVESFQVGDQVYGYLGMQMGANAEYICISENGTVAIKPSNMNYKEAATLPYGGVMALSLLRKANIKEHKKVLINGASGGIGSIAIQLTKYFGAEVTGIGSAPRLNYIKALGADYVIDYKKEDFTKNSKRYDLIFDIMGKLSYSECKNSLTQNGLYFPVSFKMKNLFQMLWTGIFNKNGKRVICALAREKAEYLIFIKELVESSMLKSVIDRTFPLESAAEAHRYIEAGKKKGSVVIAIK